NNLVALRRVAEAEAAYALVLSMDADHVSARINLANLLAELDRPAEAETLLRDGLARFPDEAELHWNLALLLLQGGRMAGAWAEYEWRWGLPGFVRMRRNFPGPRWNGEALNGRRLLLHVEQGYGDAIEFCRFVSRIDGPVVLECRPGLERLFATLAGDVTVVTAGKPLPPCDVELPLMSLPHVLGVQMDDLPGPIPYLRAPDEALAAIADLAQGDDLKIGFVWAGSPTRKANHRRSLTAADFAPLFKLAGCRFHSLQVGPALGEVAAAFGVADLAPRLKDFADTAAAIAAMDLVITVDTAVAHLAGALGKPVWVLLSKPCDGYLWMLDRADSPWYPSARLFRQPREGDWAAVFAEVAEALVIWRDQGKQ
ncbi:MAG: tetratricopeptide repeat protein, partial [Magnetospirillum sp.]|nr:tetratricopeptide repeat protein [Magnetospirillum sp.]